MSLIATPSPTRGFRNRQGASPWRKALVWWDPWRVDIASLLFAAVFGSLYWSGWATDYPMYRLWGGVFATGAVSMLFYLWAAGPARDAVRKTAYVALLAWSAVGGLVGGLMSRAFDSCPDIMSQCGSQMEVPIVERAASLWLATGSPYLPIVNMPGAVVTDYNPYSPGMMLFGMPAALFGQSWVTDMRVWSAVFTVACFVWAWRMFPGQVNPPVVALRWLSVAPPVALSFASSGVDLPVIAAAVLATSAVVARRYFVAGAALGFALGLKLTAAPIVFVVLMLFVARRDALGAAKTLFTFVPAVAVVYFPVLAMDLEGFLENTVRYTTGSSVLTSVAASPTPGHLLSLVPTAGPYLSLGVLFATAAGILVYVCVRPPATAAAALQYAGWSLLAAMLVMPASRIGYIIYPVVFLAVAASLPKVRKPAGA